ncbi:hypothetical protein SRHO_G00276490 [Serrasalmus rhombeus]
MLSLVLCIKVVGEGHLAQESTRLPRSLSTAHTLSQPAATTGDLPLLRLQLALRSLNKTGWSAGRGRDAPSRLTEVQVADQASQKHLIRFNHLHYLTGWEKNEAVLSNLLPSVISELSAVSG